MLWCGHISLYVAELPITCKSHASVTSNATNVHELFQQVFDEDIGQDKRLGIVKLTLNDLESETEKELDLRLQPSLDMLKIKIKRIEGLLQLRSYTTNLTRAVGCS
nr:hypothetical protein CFP56_78974 [Quercus suber]